jgi:hypothetical protein
MAIKSAFWGNTAFANDWQWVFGIPAVSFLGAAFSAWRGATELSTGYPIADGLIAAVIAFAITWGVAFVVRLLNVPVMLHEQQKRAVASLTALQAKSAADADTQTLVAQLWQLRNEGVIVRNRRITADEAPTWTIDYERWRLRILQVAGELSPNLRRDLEVLDRMGDVPAGFNPVSGSHLRDARIISEITLRLANYLRRHYS